MLRFITSGEELEDKQAIESLADEVTKRVEVMHKQFYEHLKESEQLLEKQMDNAKGKNRHFLHSQ